MRASSESARRVARGDVMRAAVGDALVCAASGAVSAASAQAPNETMPDEKTRRSAPRRSALAIEPASLESGAAQAAHDVWVLAHHPPDEVGALVLEHREDRALI